MPKERIYSCCICHKVLEEYKPIRLVKQISEKNKYYGIYKNKHNYDFCKSCYRKFDHWVRKYEVDK